MLELIPQGGSFFEKFIQMEHVFILISMVWDWKKIEGFMLGEAEKVMLVMRAEI